MTINPQIADDELENMAKAYVNKGLCVEGGVRQACQGFLKRSLPRFLGNARSITIPRILALLVRFVLFCAAAFFPILIRKIVVSDRSVAEGEVSTIFSYFFSFDGIDLTLGVLGMCIVGVPRVLDFFDGKSKEKTHSPYYDLAAAIEKIPALDKYSYTKESVDESIKLALQSLRTELGSLVGDDGSERLTDVSLLEFCDDNGKKMQVRVRTANHEPTRRPVDSRKFLAYYVARAGRWFVEHDFRAGGHPFPTVRLTVVGAPPAMYRSVLYLPLMSSKQVLNAVPNGQHGAPAIEVVDKCLGVICVHCTEPYRFWRWGRRPPVFSSTRL